MNAVYFIASMTFVLLLFYFVVARNRPEWIFDKIFCDMVQIAREYLSLARQEMKQGNFEQAAKNTQEARTIHKWLDRNYFD